VIPARTRANTGITEKRGKKTSEKDLVVFSSNSFKCTLFLPLIDKTYIYNIILETRKGNKNIIKVSTRFFET